MPPVSPDRRQTLRDRRVLDADVYTLACERTARILDEFDNVVILFSGGKDSTAVLEVALDVALSDPRFERHLPLRTAFYDEEAIPYETEEFVRRTAQRPGIALEWLCLPVKHRNACARRSPWWWPWAPEAEHLWCRPLPPEALTTMPGFPIDPPEARLTAPDATGLFGDPDNGNTALLMGIRAQESLIRLRSVTRRKLDNYIVKYDQGTSRGNVWKTYPVYDWTTADVWTAPAQRGWDYNRAYDRLEMAGVSASMQRCSPAFGEEPLQKLHTYASCFPDVWEKMVDRVPGVGAAARYALTELYSYRDRPEKPAGMPWPDFIAAYIEKHAPEGESIIRARLHDEIRNHYRKTTDPIAPNAPHPLTGVSWDWLLMLAMRGDYKGRKQPGGRVRNDEHGQATFRMWRRYVDDLAQVAAADQVADLAYPRRLRADLESLIPDYVREDTE